MEKFMLVKSGIDQDYSDKISKLQDEFHFIKSIYVIEEKKDEVILGIRINPDTPAEKITYAIVKLEEIFGKKIVLLKSGLEEVNYVLSKISEYLKSHSGGIKVKEVNEEKGEVVVSLQGACALCPSAIVTMKAGIRRTLSRYIPWIKKVESAEKPVEPNFNFKLAPKPQK
jgi:Fe-S cluster biogenesis protein NfuA